MAGREISVKKYVVKLSAEERERLEAMICAGKHPAQSLTKARILLKADVSEAGEGWSDSAISAALDRHAAADYAQVLKELSDVHFPAEKIRLVQDNLSTHTPASLYAAFPAPEARRLAKRFEWHYTPKHGSWLDMAESELGVLSSQCLSRRIPDQFFGSSLAVVASGMSNPFRYFNSSPEIIRLAVLMYVRYPLSLRNVEDLLAERGIDISHETVRFWWNRFGPMFAAEIRKRRVAHMRGYPQWRWHLDEAFVKVNGKLCYLWRAVDHEGEVLEAVVTAKRDKAAALKFLKRIMKKYGRPLSVVTDGLCSDPAAMKEIGNADRQEAGRRLNNRAENSHQPFRRRERAMQRFRSMKTLQKFSSVHAQVHNHFNQERHLVTRQVYKQRRSAALAEWSALAA